MYFATATTLLPSEGYEVATGVFRQVKRAQPNMRKTRHLVPSSGCLDTEYVSCKTVRIQGTVSLLSSTTRRSNRKNLKHDGSKKRTSLQSRAHSDFRCSSMSLTMKKHAGEALKHQLPKLSSTGPPRAPPALKPKAKPEKHEARTPKTKAPKASHLFDSSWF